MAIVTIGSSTVTMGLETVTIGSEYKPRVMVSRVTQSFTDSGINSDNTRIIYLVASPIKSFVPNRQINGITGFQIDEGYYAIMLDDFSLGNFVVGTS